MELAAGARSWADLVFHVLAHVRPARPVPSSVFDAAYVRFAAAVLGPSDERALGQDVTVLGKVLTDHNRLAITQSLAWLYRDLQQALGEAEEPLRELAQVRDGAEFNRLLTVESTVEVLRASALLEAPHHGLLPAADCDLGRLQEELAELAKLAPGLSGARVVTLRALGRHGRIRGAEIWIGVPGLPYGPGYTHVGWQAAHEACVGETLQACKALCIDLSERQVEAVALVLLAERAARSGMGEAHLRWYASWSDDPRPLLATSLHGPARVVLDQCGR